MFRRSALTVLRTLRTENPQALVSLMRLRLALLPVSCLCLAVSFPLLWGSAVAQGNPSVVGRWSLYPNLPFFPPHTHLLPTGKVAVWPGDIQAAAGQGSGAIRGCQWTAR